MTQEIEAPIRRRKGAPKGNRNALKHGRHVKELRELAVLRGRIRRDARAIVAHALGLQVPPPRSGGGGPCEAWPPSLSASASQMRLTCRGVAKGEAGWRGQQLPPPSPPSAVLPPLSRGESQTGARHV